MMKNDHEDIWCVDEFQAMYLINIRASGACACLKSTTNLGASMNV
jgi:hypothetical protein